MDMQLTYGLWGIILYEMLALRHPFFMLGDDDEAIKKRINLGKYAPLPDQYSKGIQELLRWCLEVDPRKRKTIAEILDHTLLSNKAKYKALVESLRHPKQ
jgi:NIMA (never in mitosis gene a)-related kinase